MLRIDRKELAAHVLAHGREVALTGKGDYDDLHLALGFLLSHGGPGEIKCLRRVLNSIWGSQGGARNLFPRQATVIGPRHPEEDRILCAREQAERLVSSASPPLSPPSFLWPQGFGQIESSDREEWASRGLPNYFQQ